MDDSKRLEMEGKWDQARGRVKEAWGVLTDDELDRTGGSKTDSSGSSRNGRESQRVTSRGSSENSSTRSDVRLRPSAR